MEIPAGFISANELYRIAMLVLPNFVTKEDWKRPLAGRLVVHRTDVDGVIKGVMDNARARVLR